MRYWDRISVWDSYSPEGDPPAVLDIGWGAATSASLSSSTTLAASPVPVVGGAPFSSCSVRLITDEAAMGGPAKGEFSAGIPTLAGALTRPKI